jgi:hypothetical protein
MADYSGDYLTFRYSTSGRVSEGSEGLLANCGNFILLGIPMTLGAFLILHLCFKALSRWRLSLLLRRFDFWGYFLTLVFEGNIQQFTFYLTSEWGHSAVFALWQRCIKTAIFLFGFVMVILAVGGAFILRTIYGRLNRHLADNNRNNLHGSVVILLQSGLRNIILGILHSTLRTLPYEKMLSLLLCVETFFVIIFIMFVPLRAYRSLHPVWTGFLLSFIRIILIGTLFFDYEDLGNALVQTAQCVIIIGMLGVYIIVTAIAVLSALR